MKHKLLYIVGLAITGNGVAQHGDLDNTFDSNGVQIMDSTFLDHANDVAVQDDGKVVVAGIIGGSSLDFLLMRYNNDGSLDNTFDGDGILKTDFVDPSSRLDQAHSVAIQPDDKIIAAGQSESGSIDIALARYNTDGSLDPSFGTGGMVIGALALFDRDDLKEIVLQPDGKIVGAGTLFNGTDNDFLVVRLNANGTLDSTFDGDGFTTLDVNGASNDMGEAVALQDNGAILVAGTSMFTNSDFAVARFLSDGTLDTTFGVSGVVLDDLMGSDDFAYDLGVQDDGLILVSGNGSNGSTQIMAMTRYGLDGTRDPSFGTAGMDTLGGAWKYSESHRVVLQPDGKTLQAGHGYTDSSNNFILVRRLADGTRDATFGTDGIVTADLAGSSSEYAYGCALQPDGKVVVAGITYGGTGKRGVNEDAAVARFLTGVDVGIIDLVPHVSPVVFYPNPIAGAAVLEYELIRAEPISIVLYDFSGRVLQTFAVDEAHEPGRHRRVLNFDPTLATGTYSLVISNGSGKMSVRLVKV